jgi:hypothetical protein
MSDEFVIAPLHVGDTFEEATCKAAREYWNAFEVYHRTDGGIGVCVSKEYRDSVIVSGDLDKTRPHVITVFVEPQGVTMCTFGHELDIELIRFAEWFQQRYPSRLLDTMRQPMTMAGFRSELRL